MCRGPCHWETSGWARQIPCSWGLCPGGVRFFRIRILEWFGVGRALKAHPVPPLLWQGYLPRGLLRLCPSSSCVEIKSGQVMGGLCSCLSCCGWSPWNRGVSGGVSTSFIVGQTAQSRSAPRVPFSPCSGGVPLQPPTLLRIPN